jgi:hypothetical protein
MKTIVMAAMAALLTFGAVSSVLACEGSQKSTADTTTTDTSKKGS